MTFYLDEDLSPEIARIARSLGLDVTSAQESGDHGWPDERQLQHATREKRCLVTKNRKDFLALTLQFFSSMTPHAGVLIVPYSLSGDRFYRIARALARYAQIHPTGFPPYAVDFLPASRESPEDS